MQMNRQTLGLFLVMTASLAGVGKGHALQCTASLASITVDPASAGALHQTGYGTLDVSCMDVSGSTPLALCATVGAGSGGVDNGGNRRMTQVLTSPTFQLNIAGIPVGVDNKTSLDSFPTTIGTFTTSLEVSVDVNWTMAGPTGLITTTFDTGDFGISYGEGQSCDDGRAEVVGFSVSATLDEGCAVAAEPLDFGAIPVGFTAAVHQSTSVSVTCTDQTAYSIGLGEGQNFDASAGMRSMASGASRLHYQLLTDEGQDWVGRTDTGTGTIQTFPVYGAVPAGQTGLTAGSYTDSVVVTVDY